MNETRTADDLFQAFIAGRLTKGEWTHEAHLITCWVALQDRTPAQTVRFLRDSIRRHNCGIGIENTEQSGYHETITRYYVTAVDQAIRAHETTGEGLDGVLSDRFCDRRAPLEYWTRDLLFSVEARLGWVPPDVSEPPWPITGDTDERVAG